MGQQKRIDAKKKAAEDKKEQEKEKRRAIIEKQQARRVKRTQDIKDSQRKSLSRLLVQSDIVLELLDARDPLGCRCIALESWVQEIGKRLVFVLTKADLVAPSVLARWLEVLAPVGPAVVVSAEVGREGVRELVQALGKKTGESIDGAVVEGEASNVKDARVGIFGYPGTGKKTLSRAIRREVKGVVRWLPEAVGQILPVDGPLNPAVALHLAVRDKLPKKTPECAETFDPIGVVRHLLERSSAQSVIRRFRLAVVDSVDELLESYQKKQNLLNKKGRPMAPEAVGRRLLAELPTIPGSFCVPPASLPAGPQFWTAHSVGRTLLEGAVTAQVAALKGRGGGPAGSSIEIASGTFGPDAQISASIAEANAEMLLDGANVELPDSDDENEEEEEEMDMDEAGDDEDDDSDDEEMSVEDDAP